ncbi:peptidoglycan DD-metalloendopeptidase family protein [uncultured Piscinibacter sp.]|uniref:peptidoglycan DD-metalloendopeptidase family protein n=1 Tax=uncultured Piscinibacter sp. TaxID=1131835 RepID=UPI0026046B69|nr:peptidoglycan DD-metalloendopeptidase family protein [uncultured Piscinibacter sp.]
MNERKVSPSSARGAGMATVLCAALLLAGCAGSKYPAPVEDRLIARSTPTIVAPGPGAVPAQPAADATKPLPGAENAGKPGYYTVKPGDTMIRVGLESGQNWKDLVKWNNLENANVIEVGQVLRVIPPGSDAGVSTRPVTTAKIEARPLDAKPSAAGGTPVAATAPSASPAVVAATAAAAAATRDGDDDINWMWPATGPINGGFEEGKSKGLGIAGKLGDPVLAAADGKVVYAGSGLRGYGNLVILKHNATYLTAYAHNQTLLVKEDQAVKRGQKIAEMGNTDSDRVLLHFEIRKQGKPVDPAKLLPPR